MREAINVQAAEIPVELGPALLRAVEINLEINTAAQRDPDLWLYRERTLALLKRYMRLSVEVGRLPSLLGREFLRTKALSYHMTFEDAVILVHDIERALRKLSEFDRRLIAVCIMEEYTHDEAARLLGCWRRTVGRRIPEVLDELSAIFLQGGLLRRRLERSPAALEAPIPDSGETLSRGQNDENLCNPLETEEK